MKDSSPTISLYLDGAISFELGRKAFSGTTPTLKIQMHNTSHAVTLVIPGYESSTKTFNLSQAIQGGLFDLFDLETNSKVSIPSSNDDPGELVIKAASRNQWFDLKVDPREDLWMHFLIPAHKYEIRWQDDGKGPWAYLGDMHPDPPERLFVRRLPRPIKFNVLDDATAPPQFSVSLTPTADVCHLSGQPRFGFKLDIISREKDVITVCLQKTPFKELHGLEEIAHVTDEEGEEVEWPYSIGCFDSNDPFISNDMFEEFRPDIPYTRMFWLDKLDTETANGGELGVLDSGSTYKAQIGKAVLGAFSNWKKGEKERLLAQGDHSKHEEWKKDNGQIMLDVSAPFQFRTI
ncbi:hypothetical protein GQ44DRAFT_759044 [Phaeosphaeriaceae sp. PMI808]|nr:hypothetical protein GQ44DRAFT_759044 [Phaeosphaeriaceae sp. PMI808]